MEVESADTCCAASTNTNSSGVVVDAPTPTHDTPKDNHDGDGDSIEKHQEKDDDHAADGRVDAVSDPEGGEGVGDEVKAGVRGDTTDREREGDDDWEGWD